MKKLLIFLFLFFSFSNFASAENLDFHVEGSGSVDISGKGRIFTRNSFQYILSSYTLPTDFRIELKIGYNTSGVPVGYDIQALKSGVETLGLLTDNYNYLYYYYDNASSPSEYWNSLFNIIRPDKDFLLTLTKDGTSFEACFKGTTKSPICQTITIASDYDFGTVLKLGHPGASFIYGGYIKIFNLGDEGICTIESIPKIELIDLQPTSTGAIKEYYQEGNIYGYNTGLSGQNPLTVVFQGGTNVINFDDFSWQNAPLKFRALGSTVLTFSAKEGIHYIKMLGDFGVYGVDIYKSDPTGKIKLVEKGVDLKSWSDGFGYPISSFEGGNLVTIDFYPSIFQKTIDSLEIYSSGENGVIDISICEKDDGTFTVDGEEWTNPEGTPYVVLVGDPAPTETSLYNEGYTFFENGFCLKNFSPIPAGGDLFFQIKNPKGEIKTTYNISQTGLYKYGNNTCSPITTNFHESSGKYYVKGLYKYNGVTYNINENFTAYTITKPEYVSNEVNPWADSVTACGVSDDSTGFLPGISRFFACMSETVSTFFSNQYQAVKKIGGFILKMSDIFTTEVKDFSFIESTHASPPLSESMDFTPGDNFKNSIFGKIKNLLWGAIAILVIIVSIGVIIIVKND